MSTPTNFSNSSSSAPKIAIKGFSLSSKPSTSKANSKPPPPSSLGKRPRTTFTQEDDSDSDDETRHGRSEAVTAFGANGAVRKEEREEKGPLIIPRLANKGLGAARGGSGEGGERKGKNLLPKEEQERRRREAAGENVKADGKDEPAGDTEISWGLTLTKRDKVDEADVSVQLETADASIAKVEDEAPKLPRTADQEALDALLGNNEKKGPDLVISSILENGGRHQPPSETDAYRRAIASAPDVSTLEDYDRVPVEEFGAALLRGMGWKGEKRGVVRDVKRRQNLLGLGAKELKDAEELGAWVQKSDVKRLKAGGGGGSGGYSGSRPPKASDYKREKEKRDERREERGGGSYRKERERERESDRYRESDRSSGRDRDRYREERDRDGYRRR